MYYLYNRLLKIKETPEKYIGKKSILLLNHYINGYIKLHMDGYQIFEYFKKTAKKYMESILNHRIGVGLVLFIHSPMNVRLMIFTVGLQIFLKKYKYLPIKLIYVK